MARKELRDVAYVANWLSEVGALGGVARFLDASLPQPPDLTALSGHAFQLVVREGAEGLFPITAPAVPSYARAVAQYSVLGLRGRIYEVRPEDRASRDGALRAVRRSIDRKRPVIAFGLHIPEFGIIRGYDDDRAQLIVSTLTTEQHGPALPLALWPAPNTKEAIPIVLVDRERRIRPEVAEQEALSFAVREYEAKPGAGELAVGAAGYECWISALGSERAALHGRGHAHAVQKLLAARREAAQFLAGLADRRPAMRTPLLQASKAYREEALALSRLTSLFPYPHGGDIGNPRAREQGARYLASAYMNEGEAISSLREALRSA